MAWRAITEADVLTQISGPELEAIRAAALGSGQVDPVQPTLDLVTREVRGYVAGCARNRLGAAGTVPDELIGHAVSLAVMRIMPRAAGLVIGEQREKAAADARAALKDVAACRFAIEQPATESTEETGGGDVEMATTPTRLASRAKMAGL